MESESFRYNGDLGNRGQDQRVWKNRKCERIFANTQKVLGLPKKTNRWQFQLGAKFGDMIIFIERKYKSNIKILYSRKFIDLINGETYITKVSVVLNINK